MSAFLDVYFDAALRLAGSLSMLPRQRRNMDEHMRSSWDRGEGDACLKNFGCLGNDLRYKLCMAVRQQRFGGLEKVLTVRKYNTQSCFALKAGLNTYYLSSSHL